MINLLPSNVFIYCIFPYLRDAERRALSITNKKMNNIIDRYCLADKSSIEDLCQRGDLLIIYKRNLIVNDRKHLKLICERGYVNLTKRSVKTNNNKEIFCSMLFAACRGGHRNTVDFVITLLLDDSNSKNWDIGLHGACFGGNVEIVVLMITQGANNWNEGFLGACHGGHKMIVNLMIRLMSHSAMNPRWGDGMSKACLGGHREIVDLMIEKGADDWNEGLIQACLGGHRELVNLMIERGADGWYIGLYSACRGGHREIVDLMITLLGNNGDIVVWGRGLFYACLGGHREIVDLMISLLGNNGNVNNWNCGLRGACMRNKHKIVKLMVEKGATHCDHCIRTMEEHLQMISHL